MKYLLGFFFTCNFLFAATLTPVTLQLAWKYQFQFAGYIMAKEKGFFQEEGLNVTLKEYEFGMDVQTEMLEGNADFAIGRSTLILDRLEDGHPFKLMFALGQASPVMLQALKREDLKTLEDIKGKKFLFSGSGGLNRNVASVWSMLHSVGVKAEDVIFVQAKKWDASEVTDGTGDVITAYSTITPFHLKKQGFEPLVFHPKDYGFDFYGDILFAMEPYLQKHPKVAEGFYRATVKGWEYAFANVGETIDTITSKYNTQKLDRDLLAFEAAEFTKLAYQPGIPLGDVNPVKIEKIVNTYRLLGFAKKNPQNDFTSFIYEAPTFKTLRLSPEERTYIKDNPLIKVGVRSDWKPYDYVNEKGLHVGMSQDILELVSQRSGLRFTFDVLKDKELYHALETKKIDMIGISPKIKNNAISQSAPVFSLREHLFKLATYNEEEVKRIAVVETLPSEKELRKSRLHELHPLAKTITFETLDDAFAALQTRKVDLLYATKAAVYVWMQDHQVSGIEMAFPKQGFKEEFLYASVLKEDTMLQSIVSKALLMINEEEKRAIQNQWIPLVFKAPINWTLVWQIVGFVTLFIMAILYKHLRLRRLNKRLSQSEKELRQAHERLRELAHRDPLTKLYNRRYFEEAAERMMALSLRHQEPLCVLMLDIDDFKVVNDTYGHAAGDSVLVDIAQRINYNLRKSDIIARYGGEEFIFLLPDTSLEGAATFAEKIRGMIETSSISIAEGKIISVTVSIGVASLKTKTLMMDELFKKADEALYIAKKSGKNNVVTLA